MNAGTMRSTRGYGLGVTSQVMAATGGVLMSLAPVPVAGPFIAIAGAVTELLASIGIGAGCGNTCIQASNYANQAESLLKQNLAAYMALATPRPMSAQQAALNNFTQIWNGLVTACAAISGAAGTNCVADRQQGACHYQVNGACWNWYIGYHDPIANDPNVYNDSVASSSPVATSNTSATAAANASGGSSSTLLLIGGAVLVGLLVMSRL